MDTQTASLEDLLAWLFIARPDVKAYQAGPGNYLGQYFTHIAGSRENPQYLPWTRRAIQEHLNGQATYGHYLLSKDNNAKLFAFDIDIKKRVQLPTLPIPSPEDATNQAIKAWEDSFVEQDGRESWQNRAHPARAYMRYAMRALADKLALTIEHELQVPTITAYTGNKGLHVYGFTGLMPAREIREAASLVLESLPIEPTRGNVIFEWKEGSCQELELFTIEVFPKQDEIGESGFGNLMRLPMGRNQKSNDPTFILDTTVPLSVMKPADPLAKLREVAERVK